MSASRSGTESGARRPLGREMASAALLAQRRPTESEPILVHWVGPEGRPETADGADCRDAPLEYALPSRSITVYPDQQHTPGLYWSATSHQMLGYESHLELRWMTLLDFDADVVAMSAQPCLIEAFVSDETAPSAGLAEGTRDRSLDTLADEAAPAHAVHGSREVGWVHHPDLFVRRADGTPGLIDVVLRYRLDRDEAVRRTVARSAEVCAQIGWDYQVFCEPDAVVWGNVRHLAHYRRPLHCPPEVVEDLLSRADRPIRIGDLIDGSPNPVHSRAAVMSLCWHHLLTFDLNHPLQDTTLVVAANEGEVL